MAVCLASTVTVGLASRCHTAASVDLAENPYLGPLDLALCYPTSDRLDLANMPTFDYRTVTYGQTNLEPDRLGREMGAQSPAHSFFPLAVVICATPPSLVGLVRHLVDLSGIEMDTGLWNLPTAPMYCDSCHCPPRSIDPAFYPQNNQTIPSMVERAFQRFEGNVDGSPLTNRHELKPLMKAQK